MKLSTDSGREIKPRSKSSERRFLILSLSPILLVLLLFSIAPIFWGLGLSFFRYDPLQEHSPFVGLYHYSKLLGDKEFLKTCWNTFRFVFITVSANLVITLILALMIHHVHSRFWRNAFRTVFFLPAIAPLAASAVIWSTIFREDGLLNLILSRFGVDTIYWLSEPGTAMMAIIVMTLWADMGYNIIIFMAGRDSIPQSLYEAAMLDGASGWGMFWRMTLPLMKRTTVFVIIMTLISYFQMFPQFQIMTNGGPMNETNVLALNIYNQAFKYSNMGYASAMATVLLFIIFVITMIQLRLNRVDWEH